MESLTGQGLTDRKTKIEAVSETKKKRARFPDRITIELGALSRLDQWIAELKARSQGIEITRKDLLNWLVEHHDERLTATEERLLTEAFYDEEKFLKYAWEEIRQAKAKGETLRLAEILKRKRSQDAGPAKPKKARDPVDAKSASEKSPKTHEGRTAPLTAEVKL